MNKIVCNGSVTNLKLVDGALNGFAENDLEVLQYAVWAYGFVNCTGFSKYEVSIESWVNEIKKVYDQDCKRTQKVLQVLTKLV